MLYPVCISLTAEFALLGYLIHQSWLILSRDQFTMNISREDSSLTVNTRQYNQYNTSNTAYPVCSMTPVVALWHQLQHYFSLKTRLNISLEAAQYKMAKDVSTMKVVVNVIRRPKFSDQTLPLDYVVMKWTETFKISSHTPGGNYHNNIATSQAYTNLDTSVSDNPYRTVISF